VTTFFKDNIIDHALGDPYELSLNARNMQELEQAGQKPDS
jgi:hypothetical protein